MEAGADATAVDTAAFVLSLRERGVRDTAILRAIEQVPREDFAPPASREYARRDMALPLPCGQTMTAPIVLAAMLSALDVRPGASVLEVGTGSGYATALLIRLGAVHVRSLERYATLSAIARDNLGALRLAEVTVETADGLGSLGPGRFNRILVNGALANLPVQFGAALAPGGRLVAGLATEEGTRLLVVARWEDGSLTQSLGQRLPLALLTPGRARVL